MTLLLTGESRSIAPSSPQSYDFPGTQLDFSFGDAPAGFAWTSDQVMYATMSVGYTGPAFTTPHHWIAVEYFDPMRGHVVTETFLGGGSRQTSFTIRTGSLDGTGTGQVKVRVFNVDDGIPLPDLGPFNGTIGEWYKFARETVGAALDRVGSLNDFTQGQVNVLGIRSLPPDLIETLLGSNFPSEYLENLGFDPNDLPDELKGQFDSNGRLIGLELVKEFCFAAGTQVMRGDGTLCDIEDIRVGDLVMAFDPGDPDADLDPCPVSQTHVNMAKHLLDVAGLKVTPGHVFQCGDGPNKGQFEPLIDIILRDGALVRDDGTLVRPSIDAPVGSAADREVQLCYITHPDDDPKPATLRAGTRLVLEDGEATLADVLARQGIRLTEDGLVEHEGARPAPLNWFGQPPRPEDYVLAKSGLTLDDLCHEVDGVTRLKAGEPVH